MVLKSPIRTRRKVAAAENLSRKLETDKENPARQTNAVPCDAGTAFSGTRDTNRITHDIWIFQMAAGVKRTWVTSGLCQRKACPRHGVRWQAQRDTAFDAGKAEPVVKTGCGWPIIRNRKRIVPESAVDAAALPAHSMTFPTNRLAACPPGGQPLAPRFKIPGQLIGKNKNP